jgi:lipoprotein-releasing system permease protein
MRNLLERPGEASFIEVDISADNSHVKDQIKRIAGDGFTVQNRFEQNAALFRLMNIEKWLSYAIAGLTLAIVSFNLIGALWMIVLDKKKDISVLRAMGTSIRQVRDMILIEGLLICLVGVVGGMALAATVFVLQKNFGIVGVPEGFVVDAYPVVLRLSDFLVVTITVLAIGLLASVLPAKKASLIPAYLREE